MAKYSRRSLERLWTCVPELIMLFDRVILTIDCTILCGHRTEEEQNALFYADPPVTRCKWPDSEHNAVVSNAVDVAPYYARKPHVRWSKQSLRRWYFFGGIVLQAAIDLGLSVRWGGDWDGDTYVRDQTFNDLPHWQVIKVEDE